MLEPRVEVNAAQCLGCLDILESKYTHDFVTCSCGGLSVDGGLSYIKRCGNPGMSVEFRTREELDAARLRKKSAK